ncbi:peptidase inhibitor family I36 protein [Streptomyces sp. NBC_00572]|uniref:peptidase inhibitor family I36 protein n=1 Tax=Streptomyces sp. NBC_00572 TaxID=2903664 RepID=UPI0022588939|nr:peptidase inhibitor family I36 protein [Streptomyces sp. NBC_00572]MCX4982945.1 peptidase inhibitor family I36 protein [Streptomyces sp. NBC_00572]
MIKRRIGVATAVLGLAALGLTLPGTAAQATSEGSTGTMGAGCDSIWRAHQGDGNMWAFSGSDCTGDELGHTPGEDADWSNSSGEFTGNDNDRATSLVNTGTEGGRDAVAFYRDARYVGGHGCVSWGEKYVDNLNNDTFTTETPANNEISSHQWVAEDACSKFFQ